MSLPVLFLPGLLCDARLWRDQVAALSADHACLVADLTQDDAIAAMVARTLADAPDRFALCGLSMGGYVALALMRAAPGRVARLCLMDTRARPDTPDQARHRRGLMAMTRGNRFNGVTSRLLPSLLHPDRVADEALAGEVMLMAARVGKAAFLRQQTAILNRADSRPHLAAIAVPTWVLVGEADQLTPPELSREMAAAIPGARLALIADAGHLPPMEQPEATTALLREWLSHEPG